MKRKNKLGMITVREGSTIKETMKKVDLSGFGMAVIVDGKGRLKGVATDGDIRRGILKGHSLNEKITEIMNKNPFFVKDVLNYGEIHKQIREKRIVGKVPVVNEKGIVQDVVLVHGQDGLISYIEKHRQARKSVVKKVLVIGGAGYIGSVLCRKLLAEGYKVKVLDCLLYGDDSIKELYGNKNFEFLKGDTLHIESVVNAVKDVDAVVHLAELVGDPLCAIEPTNTLEVNYLATKLIADVCRYFQVNRFLYMSSCSVYGASEKEEMLTEKSPLNPVSLYAKMKIQSEKAILAMVDENFSPCIFRSATVYGLSPRMRFDLVVNVLTAKAVSDKEIPVFGGDQWRPNVNVEDAADAIITALEAPFVKIKGEVFNLGSDSQNCRIIEIGKMVKDIIPEAELIVERKEVDKRNYKVSFAKIKKVLGFKPKKTIKQSIKEIKEAIQSRKIRDYRDKRYNNYDCFRGK